MVMGKKSLFPELLVKLVVKKDAPRRVLDGRMSIPESGGLTICQSGSSHSDLG